jgi:hypothetical protein
MLSTPRCPECGTVYRWQTLLHVVCPRCGELLEAVDDPCCPRCGLDVDWPALFDQAPPAPVGRYEYTQWPVRAAVHTWLAALRPRRFWQGLRLEAPPVVSRLRWLLAAAVGTYTASAYIALTAQKHSWGWVGLGRLHWALYAVAVLLPLVTMIGLPLFVPTLARFRIRRDQLLRCWAYGATGMVWIGGALVLAAALVMIVNAFWPVTWTMPSGPWQRPRLMICSDVAAVLAHNWAGTGQEWTWHLNVGLLVVMVYFTLVWWWLFLWTALHRYLRINRRDALALFASTQLIGLFAAAILLVRYTTFGELAARLLNRIAS